LEALHLVETLNSAQRLASKVEKILTDPGSFDDQKRRGQQLLARMEDPVAKILSTVELAQQKGTR
jgi:hypothetical protein